MEKLFKLQERGTTVSKEIIGGITTFLAMSYILAVNPSIISGSGLELPEGVLPSWNAVFTATAISSALATLVMAFLANLPVALAPGLGMNAFFTYTVVLGMGVRWQLALTAVLLEGILFIVLSLFGIREAIVKSIPDSIKTAVAVGLGLFIAVIGLSNAGICTNDTGTLIGFVNLDLHHSNALVAVIGLIITIILYILKNPGAILIGIAITTLIGIPFGVTKIPEGFNPFTLPSSPNFFAFDFTGIFHAADLDPETGAFLGYKAGFSGLAIGKFFIIFFTFLFTDMFDTIGTLLGVSEQGNLKDEEGNIQNCKQALLTDAIGTVAGACVGTSTVSSYIESASGVAAGARTGLASVVTAVLFILSLFFTNVFSLVPAAATAPALIFVGYLMMKSVVKLDFTDLTEGIPAYITIMTLAFSYSISKGIMWGIISYVLAKCVGRKVKDIPVITWILAFIFLADIVFEALKS